MPERVEVGERVLVKICSQAPLTPALQPEQVKAPAEMVRPEPVMSVMAASDPIFRESVTVVVAFKEPVSRRLASIVEEAVINKPAVVEVGVKALAKAKTRLCSVALPV